MRIDKMLSIHFSSLKQESCTGEDDSPFTRARLLYWMAPTSESDQSGQAREKKTNHRLLVVGNSNRIRILTFSLREYQRCIVYHRSVDFSHGISCRSVPPSHRGEIEHLFGKLEYTREF